MQIICPSCHTEIKLYQVNCSKCDWDLTHKGEIPVYLSDGDKKSDLFKEYLENYDLISELDLDNSIQDTRYLQIQTEKLFSYLPNLIDKNILELGVGQGYLFKKLCKASTQEVFGVDIATNYIDKLKDIPKARLLLANAENLPFKGNFDVIIATDILEHVLNVGDFLISLKRSLKPGGKCVIRVPYLENLTQYAQQNGCPYKFVHLRTFSTASLKSMFEQVGFTNMSFHYDGYQPYRTRNFPQFLKDKIHEQYHRFYKNDIEVAKIDNWLGRMVMLPLEITLVAEKA